MLIGLGYRAHVGKDTAALALSARHGFRRLSFGDKIRDAAAAVFGFTAEQLRGAFKESIDPRWGMTPRRACQDVAEAMIAAFGSDVWIRAAFQDADHPRIVVPDLRRWHEADEIHRRGGWVVRVDRDVAGLTGEAGQHRTEHELDHYPDWDYRLDNQGSHQDLTAEVDRMIEQLQRGPGGS